MDVYAPLTPQDVEVDLYLGRVAPEGELVESRAVPLQAEGKDAEGAYHYVGATAVGHSGLHGFTLRVRPSHPDLSVASHQIQPYMSIGGRYFSEGFGT